MPKQFDIQQWAKVTFEEFLSLLLVGWVLVLWFKPRLTAWADQAKAKPWLSSGYGLIGLVVAVNAGVLLLLALIVILVIFFALGFISLWKLATIFGALAIFSLGLFSTVFFLFIVYGSKAIVAYMVARWVAGRISEGLLVHRYLLMFTGMLVYVLLQSIPYVGWAVESLVTVMGLGAVWLVYRDQREQKKALERAAATAVLESAIDE